MCFGLDSMEIKTVYVVSYHLAREKARPIKYIFEKSFLSRRLARWQVLLFEYNIEYVFQKVIKGSAIVKFLADRAINDYELITFDFPNEDLMAILQINEE